MNRKTRKLLFIRSKNYMLAKGHRPPKWKLVGHSWPTKWVRIDTIESWPTKFLEDRWVIDMVRR